MPTPTGVIRTGTTAGDTLKLQAYDTDTGPAYVDLLTLTAGTTPTFLLRSVADGLVPNTDGVTNGVGAISWGTANTARMWGQSGFGSTIGIHFTGYNSTASKGAFLLDANGAGFGFAVSMADGFLGFKNNMAVDAGDVDAFFKRDAAATIQMGKDVNGSAVAQTFKAHDGITGTDLSGANFTLAGGRGTGAGAASAVYIATPTVLSTGTTAQVLANRFAVTSAGISHLGLNAQATTINQATSELTGLSGATVTATNLIPAGSLVLGVSVRVTTLITGATSFAIGDGTDADRWGTGIAVTAGTVTTLANITITSPIYYAAATSVVLTAAGSNFTAGAVRITVHFISLTAPTS